MLLIPQSAGALAKNRSPVETLNDCFGGLSGQMLRTIAEVNDALRVIERPTGVGTAGALVAAVSRYGCVAPHQPSHNALVFNCPSKLPLPTPSNLEFQSALGGNHNSKWISESVVGLIVLVTRQNGTLTVIFGPAVPRANVLNGCRINCAESTGPPEPANAAHAF